MTEYKFRSVVLPFSGLEVQGEDWDEFEANLIAALGDADLATAYLGMRQFEVKKLVEDARKVATGHDPVLGNAVNEVKTQLGGTEQVLCPGHGEPAKKGQVKKDGANKGRYFHACARPQGQQCDFFSWA